MFSLNESNRYYLYPYPTDMRKSFYTLSGIVTNQMGKNVRDGDAFIFINANCTCMKILHMEYGGLVIYHMRLEHGHFHLPVLHGEPVYCLYQKSRPGSLFRIASHRERLLRYPLHNPGKISLT